MLSKIGEIQTPLPAIEAVFIGLVVAIVAAGTTLWRRLAHGETVVHESAHALVGIVNGRQILSVNVNTNGGGATDMVPKSGFGYGVAVFVGYIGASVAGLIAASLISTGRMVAVLWLGLLLFAVMVLLVRNFFGAIVTLTCGALLYLVLRYATAGVQTAAAYIVTWFLLIFGIKRAFRVARKPEDAADAVILAQMSFLGQAAWCWLWLALTIAALVVAGAILTRALAGLRIGPMPHEFRCVPVAAAALYQGRNWWTTVILHGRSADDAAEPA